MCSVVNTQTHRQLLTRYTISCGWAQVSCWTRSTAMTSWCSALASPSRIPLAISVLSSTVSCRWQPMSRAGYNQLHQLRPVVRSLSVNVTKTLVQAFISCRLDYCNSLLYGISDGLLQCMPSVGAERRRSPGHRRPSQLPHHTSVAAAALAASSSASRGARASVAGWCCSRVSC